jgi:hypothetical protein
MGTGGSFPGVKRQGREADHSPPTSAEAKKMWIYTSTPLYASWRSAELVSRGTTLPWKLMGEWRYGTRWKEVVSLTLRQLYHRGQRLRCPSDRRVNGPIAAVEKRKFSVPAQNRIPLLRLPLYWATDVLRIFFPKYTSEDIRKKAGNGIMQVTKVTVPLFEVS